MMGLSFLGPLLASILYVIVFQKAGFRGAILAVCAGPLLGALVSFTMGRMTYAGGGMPMSFVAIFLISLPLSLMPLLVLAFKSWPPVGGPPPGGRS
ncbi:hypothetical protein OU426_03605 [Frigidibacter sp. RF13]|uniref:hypothetical protein n=1 Tax=Frigidibacter sp. RF13 TaxID=2997340 RepID=UPI00226F5F6A|nr:hypothetical protein [Frigidibacter sp. RF13]MCY1125930.1 hypothetical protein [Frigidibacter sp. RF13]